jgi:hypothetical protein
MRDLYPRFNVDPSAKNGAVKPLSRLVVVRASDTINCLNAVAGPHIPPEGGKQPIFEGAEQGLPETALPIRANESRTRA